MSKNQLFLSFLFCILNLSTFAYWQQDVKYDIQVKLDDNNHTLSAFQKLVYTNNSPDTLSHIYMHLWPNAYKDDTELADQILEDGKTLLYWGDKDYTGKIDSIDFRINNKSIQWRIYNEYPDIAKLELPTDLLPGQSVTITTPFRVKLPIGQVSRFGHLEEELQIDGEESFNERSYQVTQWYPKPAVYDDLGWHRLPYLNIGEFYSEYGEFNVEITFPKEYTIAATGDEVSRKENKSHLTVAFQQEKIHDFAWFVDNDWITEKSSISLPYSGRVVETMSKYKRSNRHLWRNSVNYIDSAIYYYSLWVGDYPYNTCSAVDGGLTAGSGMEYPNVTVIGETDNRFMLEEVILHEVGHNWFYGILGSNERVYPWMDEGINSYYERRYYEEVKKNATLADMIGEQLKVIVKDSIPAHKEYHALTYEYVASRNMDLPINLPANQYSELNYGAIVYAKAAISFNYLEKYLGKKAFDKIMQNYFEEWKFKHPSPEDLKSLFEKETGENLDWFFEDLLNTSYQIDYKINNAGFNPESKNFEIDVTNKGDIASPVVISATRNRKVVKTVWYEGFEGRSTLVFPNEEYDEIIIDYYHDIPEINRNNNRFRMYDLFGKLEPIEASFFFNFDKSDKTQIFATPLLGYNNHDQLQLGFGFYNSLIKEKPFRFILMPQYSFGTNKLIGYGKATYSLYPNDDFQKINFNLSHKKQGLDFGLANGAFSKTEYEVDFIIGKKNDRSNVKSNFSARLSDVTLEIDRRAKARKSYLTFTYDRKNKRAIHPYEMNLMAQSFEQNWKVQAELNYHFTISKKLEALDLRLFGGYFLENNNAGTERFRLTANNGRLIHSADLEQFSYNTHDYLFDQVMIGRFINNGHALASQQIYKNDGAFKVGYNLGLSSSWLGAVNLNIPTPVKFLSVFMDVGTTESIVDQYNDGSANSPILYDFGVQLNVVKKYFEIYFPLLYSEEFDNNYEISGGVTNYLNKVKFMFNINELYNIYR